MEIFEQYVFEQLQKSTMSLFLNGADVSGILTSLPSVGISFPVIDIFNNGEWRICFNISVNKQILQ